MSQVTHGTLAAVPLQLKASCTCTQSLVAQLVGVPAWGTKVLKALGSIPVGVYWLLDLCATGVLQNAYKNWEQTGAVIAASHLRQNCFTAQSKG